MSRQPRPSSNMVIMLLRWPSARLSRLMISGWEVCVFIRLILSSWIGYV